ncbi:hypothetical protein J6590_088707 [Homalodisca vitripennis]|nr:hypothetical protein J6590_088707 [Homalodisca vitripennis]
MEIDPREKKSVIGKIEARGSWFRLPNYRFCTMLRAETAECEDRTRKEPQQLHATMRQEEVRATSQVSQVRKHINTKRLLQNTEKNRYWK